MSSETTSPTDTPETIHLEVDTTTPTGESLAYNGERLDEETAIVEEHHIEGDDCEECGDANGQAYVLDDSYGIPVCLPCLEGMDWINRIESDRSIIA